MAHRLNGRDLKRAPELSSSLHKRYAQKSKADWADLYFDLYRQVFGEQAPDEECMADAERRLEVLKRHRQPAQDEAERPWGQPANYDDTPADFEPDPDLYYQEQQGAWAEQLGDPWTGEPERLRKRKGS